MDKRRGGNEKKIQKGKCINIVTGGLAKNMTEFVFVGTQALKKRIFIIIILLLLLLLLLFFKVRL